MIYIRDVTLRSSHPLPRMAQSIGLAVTVILVPGCAVSEVQRRHERSCWLNICFGEGIIIIHSRWCDIWIHHRCQEIIVYQSFIPDGYKGRSKSELLFPIVWNKGLRHRGGAAERPDWRDDVVQGEISEKIPNNEDFLELVDPSGVQIARN